jgi:selenium metabolism protein YedF
LNKRGEPKAQEWNMEIDKEFVLVITSATLGEGEPDLGGKLVESFFQVLSDWEHKPARVIFINSGVFLTTEGSPIVESLRRLEESGTEILSCTTCLTYFDRLSKILVGRSGNMKETVDSVVSHKKVVTF